MVKKTIKSNITKKQFLENVKKAKKYIPDIIILDVMMPEMDGIEACERLRKLPELNHSIITFLTARGEDYSQVAGFDAGADDYITKPFSPNELIARLRAVNRRQSINKTITETKLDDLELFPNQSKSQNKGEMKQLLLATIAVILMVGGVSVLSTA